MALLVFLGGAGLGFAWKQGWMPVELLPAQTGDLDPQIAADAEDPLAPLTVPPPLAERTDSVREVADPAAELPFFPAQAEPTAEELEMLNVQPFRRNPPADLTEAHREASRNGGGPQRLHGHDDYGRRDDDSSPLASSTPASRVQPAGFQTDNYGGVLQAAVQSPVGTASAPVAVVVDHDLELLLSQYDHKVEQGEVLAAHRLLSQAYWKTPEFRPEIQERLDRTASTIFFLPQPHFVEPHLIEPGDRLEAIAAEYKVPWEYLSKLNRVDPKRIQAGKRLKVVRGPFSAVVELSNYTLTVHLQGYYVRQFPVGIGKDGASPIGKFSVLNKVVDPQYTDPDGRVIAGNDPTNPLGSRWIDLGNSYGIHGTIEPDTIGQAASRGCVRLRDADIVAVYNFLTIGSEVVIRR